MRLCISRSAGRLNGETYIDAFDDFSYDLALPVRISLRMLVRQLQPASSCQHRLEVLRQMLPHP